LHLCQIRFIKLRGLVQGGEVLPATAAPPKATWQPDDTTLFWHTFPFVAIENPVLP